MSVPGGTKDVTVSWQGGRVTLDIPMLPKAAHPDQDGLDLWWEFVMSKGFGLGEFQDAVLNADTPEAMDELRAIRTEYKNLTKKQINALISAGFERANPELVAQAKREMARDASARSKKALQRASKASKKTGKK